jgi:hydroxyacylglutathione hydrolase
VGQLPDRVGDLDAHRPTVVYCAGGYRSSVAASMLRQRGFEDVSDLLGGYNAWDEAVQNA